MKPSLSILAHINIIKSKRIYARLRFSIKSPIFYANITKAYILLLCFATSTPATSIVVSRTSHEIVIGADSKGSFDDGKTSSSRNVCKIYQRGNIIFAVAGIAHNPITGFDPATLIVQEIKSTLTIMALVANVEITLKSRLESELSWQKSERPDLYQRTIRDSDIPLSLVIAGVENGSPVFYARAFKITGDILREDRLSGEYTVWMGKANAITRFIGGQTKRPIFQTAEETVRTLIQLEIDDPLDSRTVSGPIDIVRITSKGPQWIQKKPECGEKKEK